VNLICTWHLQFFEPLRSERLWLLLQIQVSPLGSMVQDGFSLGGLAGLQGRFGRSCSLMEGKVCGYFGGIYRLGGV